MDDIPVHYTLLGYHINGIGAINGSLTGNGDDIMCAAISGCRILILADGQSVTIKITEADGDGFCLFDVEGRLPEFYPKPAP